MAEPIISVQGLTTVFGSAAVVEDVSFDIHRGETYALVGESGSGKSMTALSIMRLLPDVGRIRGGRVALAGRDLLTLPEAAMRDIRGARMAMIFQEPMTSLNPVLTVGKQIGEALKRHQAVSRRQRHNRVLELLASVQIPEPGRCIHDYPHQLSGGMKQRAMIAMAIAANPELLIADEPTTALDVTIQARVLRLLKDLQQEIGMAMLFITHDLGVVADMADRVAVMRAGEILEASGRDAFFRNPRHDYSRRLFDSVPTMAKRGQRLSVVGEGKVKATEAGARPATADDESHRALLSIDTLKVYFPIQQGLLKRTVGHVKAVDGVSLDIRAGRTLALVGESGSGKTTVGKGILQLERPTAGSVRFEGKEMTRLQGSALRRCRADVQIVFQDPFASMNPRMMIGDIIEEGMKVQGVGGDSGSRRARIRELLQQVGLRGEIVDRYPHEFSGGQRQRICIARALAVEAKLIICDEPTSALDVSVQAQILNLLQDLQARLGLAYLFITHNISVVAYLAHEVAVMYQGRIVEHGSVDQVLNHPRHEYTRTLLAAVPTLPAAQPR